MKKLFSILNLVFILGMESQAQTMCADSIKCDNSNFTLYLPSTNAPGNALKIVRLDTGGASVDLTVTSRTAIGSSIIIIAPKTGLTCSDNAVTTTYLNNGGNTLGSCATFQALPVELISFNITRFGSSNMLNWSTAFEINNSYFEIQKSVDGKLFNMVTYLEGTGTTSEVSNYEYLDYERSTVYYKLKQVDYGGEFEYSNIIKVVSDEDPDLLLTTIITMQGQVVYMDDKPVDLSKIGECGKVMVIKQYNRKPTTREYKTLD